MNRILLNESIVSPVFLPREKDAHKGTFGTAALVGGCESYAGAVKLANLSLSALRSGAGISRLIVEKEIVPYVAPYLLESTLFSVDRFSPEALENALSGVRSVGVGMGFGRTPDRVDAIRFLLAKKDLPVLIDADGLFALSKTDFQHECDLVITPHPGEFSRLTGLSVEEIKKDPVGAAVSFAKQYRMTVLLKGSVTVITDGERVFLNDRGCPGMATAGSGDVLSGVITGLNAQNPADLTLNAAAGAFLCGVAGELAEAEVGAVSMIASDTVRHLPEAVRRVTG